MSAMRLGCSLAFIALAALRNTRAYRMNGEDGALHQEDSELRDEMADKEEAWPHVGRKAGFEKMWIDDQFQVHLVESDNIFYSAYSYIVLITNSKDKHLSHTICFWPGAEATKSNQARAMYKALELHNHFLSIPEKSKVIVEKLGEESVEFTRLFGGSWAIRGPQNYSKIEKAEADRAEPWWDGEWRTQHGVVTWWVDFYDVVHRTYVSLPQLDSLWGDNSFKEDRSYIVLITSEGESSTYVWHGIDAPMATRERAEAKVEELRQHLGVQFQGKNIIVDMAFGGSDEALTFMSRFKGAGDQALEVQIVRGEVTTPTMWQATSTPRGWEPRPSSADNQWLLLQAPWKQSSFNPDDSFLLDDSFPEGKANEVTAVSGENAAKLLMRVTSTLGRHIRGWRWRPDEFQVVPDADRVNTKDFAKWVADNSVDIPA